jgi:hypothetical protein
MVREVSAEMRMKIELETTRLLAADAHDTMVWQRVGALATAHQSAFVGGSFKTLAIRLASAAAPFAGVAVTAATRWHDIQALFRR